MSCKWLLTGTPVSNQRRRPSRFERGSSLMGCCLLLLNLLCVNAAGAEETLRVLTWPGYADPDIVQRFEKETHTHVTVTYISSDDDLWNKIGPNRGQDYDVFAVNTAELQRYIDIHAVLPIDLSKVPNHRNQTPRFQNLKNVTGMTRHGKVFAMPYTYSEMGLIYNKKLVGTPPTSINALWDPKYRGKVLAYDASNHNFSIAAQALGFKDLFSLNHDEMMAAARKLVDLRRNIFTFYTDPDQALDIYRHYNIALVYANFGTQQVDKMRSKGLDIGYVIPKEGALAWLDCWVISAGAKDRNLALKWINYSLEPQVSEALTERQGLANTLKPGAADKADAKIIWLQSITHPEERIKLWQKIRAGAQPDAL